MGNQAESSTVAPPADPPVDRPGDPPAAPRRDLPAEPQSALRGAARLIGLLLLLSLATLTTVGLVAWFIPEVNTYSQASALKHERLEALKSPKIVVVGGSNLAFGLDSEMIEKATRRGVVNMGMDGYLGVRFLLAEVEPFIDAGDLVVIAFEHGAYYNDEDGAAGNQFAVVKAFPKSAAFLTLDQQLAILAEAPRIAQLKAARLVLEPARLLRSLIKGSDYQSAGQIAEAIGSVDGFNEYGDLEAHLDIEWPDEPFDGDNLKRPINETALELINDFSARVREKGAEVMVSYTPVSTDYLARYENELAELHRRIEEQPELSAPTAPSGFAFDKKLFFDTVYHLRREGRGMRTRKLLDDIMTRLPKAAAAR